MDSAMRGHSPRQSDIARLAQVSQAAVSMVLNDRATENGIPESTQARVRAAMAELGYMPNVAARALRRGRNNLIGVHTFERVFPIERSDYYNEFLFGIEAQAIEDGLDLVLFASTQREDGTRSIYGGGSNRLRLADGAVMLGTEQNDEELRRLAGEGFDFVFVGRRTVEGVPIPYVTADYRGAMESVIEVLTGAGHERIAYLGITTRLGPQEDRLAGVRRFALGAGIPEPVVQLLEPEQIDAGFVEHLVAGPCTAVIVESYSLARALHEAVGAAGVRVPDELSVVCLDTDSLRTTGTEWSQLGVPRVEMGRAAVRILQLRLDGEVPPDHAEVLQCTPPPRISVAALGAGRPRSAI